MAELSWLAETVSVDERGGYAAIGVVDYRWHWQRGWQVASTDLDDSGVSS